MRVGHDLPRYKHKIWGLVGVILLLNVCDIVNTLHIISSPADELNPVMAYAIANGIICFIIVKMFLITGGSVMLAKFKPSLLPYVVVLYACIVLYQLFVIFYLTGF